MNANVMRTPYDTVQLIRKIVAVHYHDVDIGVLKSFGYTGKIATNLVKNIMANFYGYISKIMEFTPTENDHCCPSDFWDNFV